MKRILLLLFILTFVNGCLQGTEPLGKIKKTIIPPEDTTQIETTPTDTITEEVVEEDISGEATETRVLIDRNKYLVGGREMFDTAKMFFMQKAGKAYDMVIEGDDKQILVELMTEADCAKEDWGEEYEVIDVKEGTIVSFEGRAAVESRNLCIYLKAFDVGEITAHIIVTELTF